MISKIALPTQPGDSMGDVHWKRLPESQLTSPSILTSASLTEYVKRRMPG